MSLGVIKNLIYLDALFCAGYLLFYFCVRRSVWREVGLKPLFVFLYLTSTALLTPWLWAYHILAFLAVPLFARSREEVGLVYIAALLATPPFSQQLTLGSLNLFAYTVYETLVLSAAVMLFFHRGARTGGRGMTDVPAFLMLLLLTFIAARDTTATNWLRGLSSLVLSFWLPYYVATRSIVSVEALRKVGFWLIAAIAMLAAEIAFEAWRNWPLYSATQLKFDSVALYTGVVKVRMGWMRAEGPFTDATIAGFVAVIGLAAVVLSPRAFASRAKYLVMIAAAGCALLAPQSRGAWLGAAVMIAAAGAYRGRKNLLASVAPAGAVAALLVWFTLQWGNRGSDTLDTEDYRTRLWARGVEEFWKSPIYGDTYHNVTAKLHDLIQGEGIVDFVNSYLYFALMSGIFGVLVFAATFVLVASRLWAKRSILNRMTNDFEAAAFFFGIVLAYVIMFAFTSFVGMLTLLTAITMGLAGNLLLAPKSRASQRKATTDRIPGRPLLEAEPWEVAT